MPPSEIVWTTRNKSGNKRKDIKEHHDPLYVPC